MSGPDPTPQPLDCLALRGEGDAVALTAGKESLTYIQLEEEVGRMAAALLSQGMGQGDRVASRMGKTDNA